MSTNNKLYEYLSDAVSFISTKASQIRLLYFPLTGTDAGGLKSSITPLLGGDIKTEKEHFLTKPVSREDLRHSLRQFFVVLNGQTVVSLADPKGQEYAKVEIGQLWHKLTREFPEQGIKLEAVNFIPVSGEKVELMRVTCTNTGGEPVRIIPTAAVPIFARGLSNKHDHEHVTSLLNRVLQIPQGVMVKPTMSFDERGHLDNETVYYVLGGMGQGAGPEGSFPTVESFCGEGGTFEYPQAVMENLPVQTYPAEEIHGKEAVGALRFPEAGLNPGESQDYIIMLGLETSEFEIQNVFDKFNTTDLFNKALKANQDYWREKSHAINFDSADSDRDSWMHWVVLQPIFRRIFGNSFLPDHDYGKGGKGWRDIWQDLLSLILIDPESVKDDLISYFNGVRIDGSNATIVGINPGEFIADRNAISRVWMDHGLWPLLTIDLYIQQTGDSEILLEQAAYFKDALLSRTMNRDKDFNPDDPCALKDSKGNVYQGTIIEHILLQHLVQFFNVGEHNITRLENADWNDGLDMAFDRGESVAFMSQYAGNLLKLAELLQQLTDKHSVEELTLAKEIATLLDSIGGNNAYADAAKKKELLWENYFPSVEPAISGDQTTVRIKDIINDVTQKAQWVFDHIRKQEKTSASIERSEHTWFNGYYDNQGEKVEGDHDGLVQMTLMSSVYPIMSGLAQEEEIKQIIDSVDAFLKDKELGGYRLNTDFQRRNYLELGRAFGFAYGTKENGSFFSHMIVMYANALYQRGFARKGYEVIQSIYQMCMDTEKSKIYPGIPEYFDSQGRGMYPYLTGAASWLLLTELTQNFGVRGFGGDLVLNPKLVKEQFNAEHKAKVTCPFAGQDISIVYVNEKGLDHGEYDIQEVYIGEEKAPFEKIGTAKVKINKNITNKEPAGLKFTVYLGPKLK